MATQAQPAGADFRARMSADSTDLAIVGGGPAGISCAITAGRLGLAVTVFEGLALGGELNTLGEVADLPGRGPVSGPDLAADLIDAMLEQGARLRSEQVEEVAWADGAWLIGPDALRASWLVVATGAQVELSGLAGAAGAWGHGLSLCASCDGPLFKGKPVAVIGAGRDALSEAETLRAYASEVLVLVSEDDPEAPAPDPSRYTLVRRVVEVVGNPVEGLRVEFPDGNAEVLPVAGVFPTWPRRPRTGILTSWGAPPGAPVAVDASLAATGLDAARVLAAGDVRLGSSATVSGALGDGVTAAWTALRSISQETLRL
jgi:thioredoxin reductase (NADPH)